MPPKAEAPVSDPTLSLSDADREVFQADFPGASITETSVEALPEWVIEGFGHWEVDRSEAFRVRHADGDETYVAFRKQDELGHLVTYLVDFRDETETGCGSVRVRLSEAEPVSCEGTYLFTNEAYRMEGLGERRLKLMNAICQTLFRQSLDSSTGITPEGKRRWEALVSQGDAIGYRMGEHQWYVFR